MHTRRDFIEIMAAGAGATALAPAAHAVHAADRTGQGTTAVSWSSSVNTLPVTNMRASKPWPPSWAFGRRAGSRPST